MDFVEMLEWYEKAVQVHNKLNTPPKNEQGS